MKILVVDDERDIQTLFQQKFRKEIGDHEMEFAFAFSGEEALEFMQANEHEAVLILSDINMPGMDGLALLCAIKQQRPDLPVMMVTAYGDDERRRKAAEFGAAEFVTKPVDFNLLKQQLQQLSA